LNINVDKQQWHCWRHGTAGGDALTLIAVCEGWLPCEEAQAGCLRGELFKRVVTHANTHLGASIALWSAPPHDAPDLAQRQWSLLRSRAAHIARYRAQINADPYFGAPERRGTGITPAILVLEKETTHG
jgi:hypothetical protein